MKNIKTPKQEFLENLLDITNDFEEKTGVEIRNIEFERIFGENFSDITNNTIIGSISIVLK